MNMEHNSSNLELDTTGLNCPLPVLKLRKVLKKMYPGQEVKVIATDPGSVKDFASFCEQTGDELKDSIVDNDKFIYTIIKKPS